MSRREYLTPPEYDPHRIAIDGDDEDPWGYSRLDRLDGLGKPLPTPYPAYKAAVHITGAATPKPRRSDEAAGWLVLVAIVAVCLLVTVLFFIGEGGVS